MSTMKKKSKIIIHKDIQNHFYVKVFVYLTVGPSQNSFCYRSKTSSSSSPPRKNTQSELLLQQS